MSKFEIINLGSLDPDYSDHEYTIRSNGQYFAGYDSMGSVNWSGTWTHEWALSLDHARQHVADLEAADMPAVPQRACAGYIIIQSIRLDPSNEIVIGHNPRAAAPYVCWDCRSGDDYNTGGYCQTYRQALLILADRIRIRSGFIPFEYGA